jgi:membrane protease YdiL (CAAX protease family)
VDTPPPARPNPFLDVVLYVVAGLGSYLLASFALSLVVRQAGEAAAVLVYALNFACLAGAVCLVGARRGRLTWSGIGLWPPRWRWRWLAAAAMIAMAMLPLRIVIGMAAQVLIEGGLDSLQARGQMFTAAGLSWAGFLIALIGTGLLAPVAEELFFRGAIYGSLRARLPVWSAVLLSALLFGLAHFDSPGVAVSSVVLGAVAALMYERTRSIWACIALHALNNSVAISLVYLAAVAGRAG